MTRPDHIPPPGKPELLCRTPGCNLGEMRFDWVLAVLALASLVAGIGLVWVVMR